ncbi:nadp-binding rossmann-fold containing [Trichoderma arundinaceum]|uniref:Nadp-binding rossmann-fold containing n=1 Tax=Trichoderma arundinaceum TaxID=490622 RepID=A0A395NDJ0_TRIAR|nr:nadp-binding rossmann-fold containing [Trichoderma arundinaceum]
MATQIVYRLTARNSFRDIKPFKEPIPTIERHEVLVKIKAVSLNYRDIAISNGSYPFPVKDSVVPCSDGAGEIVEVGAAVSRLHKGDYVIGNFDLSHQYGPQQDFNNGQGGPIDGVLREYAVLPAQSVTKIPKDTTLNFAQMASLLQLTISCKGTGGVSITGLLIAKAAGAVTIVTSSSDEKLKIIKEKYSPDYVINYKKTPDWGAEAKKITKGRGVDFIFENGGSGTIKQSLEAITFGGIVAVIGFLSPATQEDMPDVASLALAKGCVVRGILVGAKQYMDDLVTFVIQKGIQPPVHKVFGFSKDEVQSAFQYLNDGEHLGKVCIALE